MAMRKSVAILVALGGLAACAPPGQPTVQGAGPFVPSASHTPFAASAPPPPPRDACASYVGNTVTPQTFSAVVNSLGIVSPRGEFETTAQYQARIASANATGPRIISKNIEEQRFIQYDADNSRLRIQSYAFSNRQIDYWGAFYAARPPGLEASTSSNIAVLISQVSNPTGTYLAQNAFGARWTVTRVSRTSDAIFERRAGIGTRGSDRLFRNDNGGVDSFIGELRLSPDEAQRLRPQLRIAFVVEPRAPFLVTGTHQPGEVTIRNPFDTTETFRVLIADIQCGLLMDNTNKVLASFPTN